jgi:hypothetical protein
MYQIYKTVFGTTMIIKKGKYWIPEDEKNVDYLEYVKWLFDGNTPEEWIEE